MNHKYTFFTVKNAGFLLTVGSLLFTLSSWSIGKIIARDNKSNPEHRQRPGRFVGFKPFESFGNPGKVENKISFPNISREHRLDNAGFNNNEINGIDTNPLYKGQEGIIGSPEAHNWYDEASDNIFDVALHDIDTGKSYVLSYEVQGLADVTSVTRSINQSVSMGGFLQSASQQWNIVQEKIDPSLLKDGNNQILFNANGRTGYYKIRNVKISEIAGKQNGRLNITSNILTGNSFYLRGYANTQYHIKSVQILGETVLLKGNEFEYFNNAIPSGTSEVDLVFMNDEGKLVERKTVKPETAKNKFEIRPYENSDENILFKTDAGYLKGLREIDIPPVEPSIVNVGQNYYGYRYRNRATVSGIVHIPYSKKLIPKGYNDKDVATFRFDYGRKKWIRIKPDSINVEKEYIILSNDAKGDTDYINGIIKNPESPETSSFAPTTVNDIPVANPTANINMIAPPTANQQGSANVQYPIEIPAGINGLQPNISINYNSDSKSGGWAGLGWDISAVETIDIDTRWGVPEFDSTNETEIYTIGGEQLVFDDNYLPNKIPFSEARSSNRQFYFRIGVKEGTKITRKGSTTKNYTWEILDDNGVKKEYNDVLKDIDGNVVKWFLSRVTDKYGNVMTYHYNELSYNNAKNKYLSSIEYSNNTTIEFVNQSDNRIDATSSYKLGIKISEFKLLEKILVKRANKLIREYNLEYDTGDFGKRLLTNIIQKDGNGNEFNRYALSYSKNTDGRNINLFSEEVKNVNVPADNISSFSFIGSKLGLMSGYETTGNNYRGAVSFGIATSKFSWISPISVEFKKPISVGLNVSYTEAETKGRTELTDMDGDGLPDKVFYKDGYIKYRKNTGDAFSSTIFNTNLQTDLSRSGSKTNSYGLELSLKKQISGGVTYSKTNSYNSNYFADVNGDGLIDFVHDAEVFFNKINPSGGGASYESSNTLNTPNAILNGTPFTPVTTPSQESHYLANIVRVWEAPFSGNISINGYFELDGYAQNYITTGATSTPDGVDVWVEKGSLTRTTENSSDPLSASVLISKVTLNASSPTSNLTGSTYVEKGQRIYFIASSREDIQDDKVRVNTVIKYTQVADLPGTNLEATDANGINFFRFNAKDSFLRSTFKGNSFYEKGNAEISWSGLGNDTFSDDVEFRIYKLEKKGLDTTSIGGSVLPTPIFYQKLKRGEPLSNLMPDENTIAGINIENFQINPNSIDVDPTVTFLYFDVTSDTNVAWDKIKWAPHIKITATGEEDVNSDMVVEYLPYSETIKVQNIPVAGSYSTTNKQRHYPKFTDCANIPLVVPSNIPENTEVTFAMKYINYYDNTQSKLYPVYTLKKKVKIINHQMEIPYIDYYGDATYSRLFYEIHTNDYDLGKFLASNNPNVEYSNNLCVTEETNTKLNYYAYRSQGSEYRNYNLSMGLMWQGWGVFSYNGSNPDYLDSNNQTMPLREDKFYDDTYDNDTDEPDYPCKDIDPTSDDYSECLLNYLNGKVAYRYFTALELNPKTGLYQSPTESVSIDGDYMFPYALNQYMASSTTEGEPQITTATPMGIIKHTEDISLNIYGGLGPFNGSGGWSKSTTADHFIDINGDQYPDVIQGGLMQTTDITGKLREGVLQNVGDKKAYTSSLNFGIDAGFSTGGITSTKHSNTSTTSVSTNGESTVHAGSSEVTCGLSGNYGETQSKTSSMWLDINGDGLTDYVTDGTVYIFNGKGFILESGWNPESNLFENSAVAKGIGVGGVNLWGGSWRLGLGLNHSHSKVKTVFIDMNGDGLPDKVTANDSNTYFVQFNTGDSFGNEIELGQIDYVGTGLNSEQNTLGINAFGTVCLAIFKIKICISLGYNYDKTVASQKVDLRDFNGDGIPDIVVSDDENNLSYIENQSGTSNLLTTVTNPLGGRILLSYSNVNPNTNVRIGNTYQMPFAKMALTQVEIDNINEYDQYQDAEYRPYWAYKTYNFKYENGVQDRRERAFLGFGKVTTKQLNGISQVTEYETNYSNSQDFYVPYNDKNVRKYFYKTGLVKSTYTIDSINRERQRVNYIYRYFDQPADTYNLSENQTEPVYKDIGRIIPLLYKTETITTEYNGITPHSKTLITTIDRYDKYGNVLKYTDRGTGLSNTDDDIKVSITYHPETADNVSGIPQEHIVADNEDNILRKSQTTIDAKGSITGIKRYIDDSSYAEYNYEYDSYGNRTKAIFPENTAGERMFYQYQYDPTCHSYITSVTDAYGYASSTVYDDDYLFGVPKTVTDLNGANSEYDYDSFGRLTKYKSPTDTDWTIELQYYKTSDNEANRKVAVTKRKAPDVNGVTPSLSYYYSSMFTDYWGEKTATKKLIGQDTDSGYYIYTIEREPLKDTKDRIVKAYINNVVIKDNDDIIEVLKNYYPSSGSQINTNDAANYYITYKYDELDRQVKAIQKHVSTDSNTDDTLTTQTVYGYDTDRNGAVQFSKQVISPRGNSTTTYTDERGRVTSVKQTGGSDDLWISYNYNLLGQTVQVTDNDSKNTVYDYDRLGRRISENHPDAGLSNYVYDKNNHLIAYDNPVLRDLQQEITYDYYYNRMAQINYPEYTVKYEYGAPGAADYGAGRLIKQTDRSGIQMFKYSKLGQIVEEKRFMTAPNQQPKLFRTGYVYDVYNRINKITYPDGEEVYYNYNDFGMLSNIQSKEPVTEAVSDIVSSVTYDYNDQMTEVVAGNGTSTHYTRDPWGRLGTLSLLGAPLLTALPETLRTNTYIYDKDANIKSVSTTVPTLDGAVTGDISIAAEKTFDYDSFGRLSYAKILATGNAERKYYELDMAYNGVHGITAKNSRWKTYTSACESPPKEGVGMVYHYEDNDHPDAVSSITSTTGGSYATPWDCGMGLAVSMEAESTEYYAYDANGNMTRITEGGDTETTSTVTRQLFWEPQNRLKGIAQDGALHHYVYDAGGTRALKSEGSSRLVLINGDLNVAAQQRIPIRTNTVMGAYTYYPNGYAVVSGSQLNKHYYIGSNKIAAKVSSLPSHEFIVDTTTELNALSDALKAEADTLASEAGYPAIDWGLTAISAAETEEDCSNNILNLAKIFRKTHNTVCYNKLMSGYSDALLNGTVCDYWNNFKLDDCMINQPTEELEYQTYWLHPDHLGSSSVITNAKGATTNWYEYMPFGEMLMEQSSGDYNNVYKYNGKELDEATQLYYYGARYFDPYRNFWLSVDPLAIYQPVMETQFYGDGQHNGGVFNSGNLNPYIYCYQNPVILVDPNGKQVHFMHGTGDYEAKTYFKGDFQNNFKRDFGSFNSHQWSGSLWSGGKAGRIAEGHRISSSVIRSIDANIKDGKYNGNGIIIGGQSHGGNVARVVTKDVYAHLKSKMNDGSLTEMPTINLVLVNTPIIDEKDYQFDKFAGIHINILQVDAKNDLIAGAGQVLSGTGALTEKYDDADKLFEYKDQVSPKNCLRCWISNHQGEKSENVKIWYDKVKANIKKK
ncbi:MAG: toxin TcdB middle/N-terminal domain-containing protein [Bergeyella sp.]